MGYNKDYLRLLGRKQWKLKRLVILERDSYKCCRCGSTENLNIHHTYYCRYPNGQYVEPWEYYDSSLITLCRDCHKYVHKTTAIGFKFVPFKKYETFNKAS